MQKHFVHPPFGELQEVTTRSRAEELFTVPEKTSLKALRYAEFAGIITNVRDLTDLTADFADLPLPTMFVWRFGMLDFWK